MRKNISTYLIAMVWLINGLFCKVLNLVPRHEKIVATILGEAHARVFTLLIGTAEIIMSIWIISRFKSRFNAIVQMAVICIMNSLEFILAPDLLLWGKFNAAFAALFVVLIGYNEFFLKTSPSS